jgi:cell division control protein 7
MLLSLLTHKFPVFNSSDDIEALMEITAIFGRNAMEKCAMLHSTSVLFTGGHGLMVDRTIMTNVPTVDQSPPNLTDMVLRLNPHLYTPPLANPTRQQAQAHIEAMDDALDLCSKLLKLDATKRVSAKDALNHLFFQGRGMYSDGEDREEEILTGVDGKCGHLHSVADGKREFLSTRGDQC